MEESFVNHVETEIAKYKADDFYHLMKTRRTVRHFTDEEVPHDVLIDCVKAAGTAPSGANKQPWFFAIVKDKEIKRKIRMAAEAEEYEFYNKRADEQFKQDLSTFNLDWNKPHLEEASALIVIFAKSYEVINGKKERCYYPKESVGIATGILITALHRLGISTLTHTPNPMSFLINILNRPKGEKPFLILAVGHKDESYELPDIRRKDEDEILRIY